MLPEPVDAAVLKRYALIRMLLRYPGERVNAHRQLQELKQTHAGLKAKRDQTTDRDAQKELDRKIE